MPLQQNELPSLCNYCVCKSPLIPGKLTHRHPLLKYGALVATGIDLLCWTGLSFGLDTEKRGFSSVSLCTHRPIGPQSMRGLLVFDRPLLPRANL